MGLVRLGELSMESLLSYLKDALLEVTRLVFATLAASLLNVLLLHAGKVAWRLYGETHTGEHFATINPASSRLIEDVFSLTPYWQTSINLALASMFCVLLVITVMQISGLLRCLYDSLPVVLRLLWPVGLALLFASPYAAYDGQLDSYRVYVFLLLPGMFCLFWPAIKAVRRLLPDLSAFFSVMASRS
jgi:hypothetical protein